MKRFFRLLFFGVLSGIAIGRYFKVADWRYWVIAIVVVLVFLQLDE